VQILDRIRTRTPTPRSSSPEPVAIPSALILLLSLNVRQEATLNTPAEVTEGSVQGAAVLLKGKQQIGVSMCHGTTPLSCAVAVSGGRLLLLQPVADEPGGGRRMNHSHTSVQVPGSRSVLPNLYRTRNEPTFDIAKAVLREINKLLFSLCATK
jgi:hypothetical protein